jgi:hypothetical protein
MAGRTIRVLDGAQRVSHGWGWLTLGLPAALALYLFQLVEGQSNPPHHYSWAWPGIFLCLAISAVGVFLLVVPLLRSSKRVQLKRDCLALVKELRDFQVAADAVDPLANAHLPIADSINAARRHHQIAMDNYAERYGARVWSMYGQLLEMGLLEESSRSIFRDPCHTLGIREIAQRLEAAVMDLPD